MTIKRALKNIKPSVVMEQLKGNYTKSEKVIFNYIVENESKVIYHSLTELSEACGVGDATVLRFFRKLGYKGFQEFKFALAQETPIVADDKNKKTYVEKIKKNMIEAINNSYNIIDKESLQQCIEKINSTTDIVIFGVGSSGLTALDMQNRLMRIGVSVEAITDPHFQIMRSTTMNEGTVVITISLSGATKDIVDMAEIVKEKGAYIIALTNYVKSPLSKYSDLILLSAAKENPLDSGSLISKISQLYLVDLICTGLSIKNNNHAKMIKMEITKQNAKKLY